jgi:kinetochore protein Mis13/DSN1
MVSPPREGLGNPVIEIDDMLILYISLDAYHEDVEGFQFTRTNVKKAKPSAARDTVPETVVESTPQLQTPRRGKQPKIKPSRNSGVATGEAISTVVAKPEKKSRARPKKSSMEQVNEGRANGHSTQQGDGDPFPVEKSRIKGRPSKTKTVGTNGFLSPEPPPAGTSKIALPFADTPIIRRNKEMREGRTTKGQRRSSLGMRGRRASSLIDSGVSNGEKTIFLPTSLDLSVDSGADGFSTALPHREVDTTDFYKHIASEGLPEPRRMKQLLTWCATRAMGNKPSCSRSDDESASLAGR